MLLQNRKKFVRSKDYVANFCRAEENAKRWIAFRQRTGYNYTHQNVFFDRIADRVPIAKGARVLDLCCGEGILIRKLREANPGVAFEAHGLDISYWMLADIQAKMPSTRTVVGDAFALPYRDESFDYVFEVSISGMFPPELYAMICAEVRRVLKPGGRRVVRHNNRFSLYHLIEQAKYDFVKRAYSRGETVAEEKRHGFAVECVFGDYLSPSWIFYRHRKTGWHSYVPEWLRMVLYYADTRGLARLLPWLTASILVESRKA